MLLYITQEIFLFKHKLKIKLWEEVIKKLKREKLIKEVLVKADQRKRRKSNKIVDKVYKDSNLTLYTLFT